MMTIALGLLGWFLVGCVVSLVIGACMAGRKGGHA